MFKGSIIVAQCVQSSGHSDKSPVTDPEPSFGVTRGLTGPSGDEPRSVIGRQLSGEPLVTSGLWSTAPRRPEPEASSSWGGLLAPHVWLDTWTKVSLKSPRAGADSSAMNVSLLGEWRQ
jgi:hypothetical protein